MVRFALIDVHGILTKGDERKCFMRYMEHLHGIDRKEHNIFWNENLDDLNIGKKSTSEYLVQFNKKFKKNMSIKEYFGPFLKCIVVNRRLMRGINRLNLRVIIASDNFSGISNGLPKVLGRWFKHCRKFYSYKVGKTKRHGMLAEVLKTIKTKPEDCILVDDSRKNIRAARRIGMTAVFHENNRMTLKTLEKFSRNSP